MKALLTAVGICFSFFVAGESLVCQDCVNINGTNCSGNLTTCAANSTSCENGIMEVTEGGNTTVMAFKTCARSPQCHSYFFSETIGEVGFQMSKQCCTTDNCNVDPIVLPPRNNTPNGVQCPLCYAENTTSCKPRETMNCTGLETKCMYFVGKVQQLDKVVAVAARNCITKEPCDGKWFSWPDGPVAEVIKFSCDDDGKDADGTDDDDKDDDDKLSV